MQYYLIYLVILYRELGNWGHVWSTFATDGWSESTYCCLQPILSTDNTHCLSKTMAGIWKLLISKYVIWNMLTSYSALFFSIIFLIFLHTFLHVFLHISPQIFIFSYILLSTYIIVLLWMCSELWVPYFPLSLVIIINVSISLQMYDVSNFQFLTAVPAMPGEAWSAADFIQSNYVLVWCKVNI